MPAEVHRDVKDADDLERLPLNGEEDDVLFVTGRAAAFYQVFSQPEGAGVELDCRKFFPQTFEIDIFLFRSPVLEGIGGNGLEIANR
jgi:hypothetical protein